MKRTHQSITVAQKLEILEKLRKGAKQSHLADEYGVNQSVISRVKKNESELRERPLTDSHRRKQRSGMHADLEKALLTWFDQMRSKNAPINGPMMMEKAKQMAITLGIDDFEPSTGWLERLKQRNSIKFFRLHGEKADADHNAADLWKRDILPKEMTGYEDKNIFNADETGLFYKALPTGTLARTNSTTSGGKLAKERMTVLLLANADGSEKFAYAIGRFSTPRCFAKASPCLPYYSNASAWMTSKIWEDIMQKLNEKFAAQGRKVVIFVDNASCHKVDMSKFLNIRLTFLPPQTTPLLQPMDLGIIRNVKFYYRTQIMRKMLASIDEGSTPQQFSKSVNIRLALFMLKRALFLVKPETIRHCFEKAGFSKSDNSVIFDSHNEFESPDDFITHDFMEFVDCDTDAPCFGELSVQEICESVQSPILEDEEENNDLTSQSHHVSHLQALNAVRKLRDYILENNSNALLTMSLGDLEEYIEHEVLSASKQKKITDFFQRA